MNKDVNVVIFVWLQFGSTANLLQQKEVNSSSSYVIKNSFEKGEGERRKKKKKDRLCLHYLLAQSAPQNVCCILHKPC